MSDLAFFAQRDKSVNDLFNTRRRKIKDTDDTFDESPYRKPSSIYLHKAEQYTDAYEKKPSTANTHLSLPPKQPDVSLYCRICDEFINLIVIQEHRKYHRALKVLNYDDGKEPENVVELIAKRKEALQQLQSNANTNEPLDPKLVQKINDAVEVLKSDIEQTYVTLRRQFEFVNTEVDGVALNCSPACVQAVGICSIQNERWKSKMEDARVFQDYFGNNSNTCFFGVYDGHNGRFASEVCANKLHQILLQEMSRFDPLTSCTCTYNMVECNDISQYESERPSTLNSERVQLHEESTNIIHQIIHTCEDNLNNALLKELNDVTDSEKLIKKFTRQKNRRSPRDPFSEKMEIAFKKAYYAADHYLTYGLDEKSRVRWSGCSALNVMIRSNNDTDMFGNSEADVSDDIGNEHASTYDPPKELGILHVANAGNVHAVLVRDNIAYRLSKDHTPHNAKEKKRVIKLGGSISESEKDIRVNGVLSTTRGLGNHGDLKIKKSVISEPSTTSVSLDQYCQVLIMASQGVWEVLSEQDAADIVLQVLPSNMMAPPSRVSTSLAPLLDEYNEYLEECKRNIKNMPGHSSSDAASNSTILPDSSHSPIKQLYVDIPSEVQDTVGSSIDVIQCKRPDTGKSNVSKVSFKENNETFDLHFRNSIDKDDMKTEIGSNYSCESENEDSGNEGDIETITENFSFADSSRFSVQSMSKEQLYREFGKAMAERLVQAALLAGSKDNITALVVLFPGTGL